MSIPFTGQRCADVLAFPLRNPVTDLADLRARRQREAMTRQACADDLRLLSERDPEFTNPDTEARLRAAVPHLSDEDRSLLWQGLVDCHDAIRRYDGDPDAERHYLDELDRIIRDALNDDAEAAGR